MFESRLKAVLGREDDGSACQDNVQAIQKPFETAIAIIFPLNEPGKMDEGSLIIIVMCAEQSYSNR